MRILLPAGRARDTQTEMGPKTMKERGSIAGLVHRRSAARLAAADSLNQRPKNSMTTTERMTIEAHGNERSDFPKSRR